MKWQPIETAPKDGKIILAFAVVDSETGNWNMRLVSWNRYRDSPEEAAWTGWNRYGEQPTHWMPLPDPPEGA